jgi:hypothetical protein
LWDDCRQLSVAAIEYGPVDDIDLSQHPVGQPKNAWSQLEPMQQKCLRLFVGEMKEGDLIYVKEGPTIVGKGIVTGPYQFDKQGRIKSKRTGAYWRHQRPVQWIPEFPEVRFQFGTQQIATVKQLTDEEVARFEQALGPSWLSADEADRSGSNDDSNYVPQEGDRRKIVERQIRERRGQQQFRDALRERYGDRCLVTGCEVLAVLEAAHIKPYRGGDDNHAENGLLLRADIHTVFDLNLMGIEPERLQVELHPDLAKDKSYANLAGITLRCEHDNRPSSDALRLRYEEFHMQVHGRV